MPLYQVTMATMNLSGDVKLWWRTRYEDVLEWRAVARSTPGRNEIGSSRKGAVPAWERCMARTRVPNADLRENQIDKEGL